MIDTHAHLTDAEFSGDLRNVLRRAETAGVRNIVCVSESVADAEAVLRICATHGPFVQPAVGLHPDTAVTLTSSMLSEQVTNINALLSANASSVVAIGEVGLDFTPRVIAHAPTPEDGKARQTAAFSALIDIASRFDLPLSVHSRAAGRHTLSMLTEAGAHVRACMHAFDGHPVYAERALDDMPDSFYFSVPPSIVRSDAIMKLVRRLPLDRLLLESDAPALPAVAGERNEPVEIIRALHMIAALKSCSPEDARAILTRNTHTLFTRLKPS